MSAELVEAALAASRTDECIVIAGETSQANLRWAANSLTTNGVMHGGSLTVVAIEGDRVGTASSEGHLDADQVVALVRAAEQAAHDSGPAPDVQPLLTPDQTPASLVPFDSPAPSLGMEALGSFAHQLADVFALARGEGWGASGFAEQEVGSTWLGTSTGVRLRHDLPNASAAATGRRPDGSASVWAGRRSTTLDAVDTPGLGAELSRLLEWSSRRVDLAPGRYEVLLPPAATADLMIAAYWALSGRIADEGRNVYSKAGGGTRVGERLGPQGLRLYSDPAAPGLPATPFEVVSASHPSASVFDNGWPLTATDWIADGVLTSLMDTRTTAAASGRRVSPGIGNLLLDGGGTASLDEMIASTQTGLLLTSLWYIREVDPATLLLTGLTRDGVFLVEDGEVVGAVNNFRFNESPVDMLGRITEVGRTVSTLPREWGDYFQLTAMPPLRVEGFNMSSVSPAT